MKLRDVHILNWKPFGNPPGHLWWKNVEQSPDEQLIEARFDIKLSYSEYKQLLQHIRSQDKSVMQLSHSLHIAYCSDFKPQ